MANIIRRPAWHIPESQATPEGLYHNRRAFLKTLGIGGMALAGLGCGVMVGAQEDGAKTNPHGPLPEFERNPDFADAGREITEKKYPISFNNFYEFAYNKSGVVSAAEGFYLDPYTLTIDGLVDKPMTFDLDAIEALGYEERVYRFRCVEAWSMTVPWGGVTLKKLLDKVSIKPEAKYIRFETFMDPDRAPNQRDSVYQWPYREGLRLDEAMNDLTMLVTGLYGERLRPQNGTPLRVVTPWKYGFKQPKSVVKMSLVAEEPATLWNDAVPSEYKFYSNVDPEVPHPRWSQAKEKLLGATIVQVPTQWYNGYEEQVAHMYEDKPRKLY